MPTAPILMYFALLLVIPIFTGGALFCFYQYRLYKLTRYSDTWRPWGRSTMGVLGLEIGMIIAVNFLFLLVFTSIPELIAVETIYIPIFFMMYAFLITSSIGINWAAFGLRKYWKNVRELAIKAGSSE